MESFLRVPRKELTPLTMPVVVASKGTGLLGHFKKRKSYLFGLGLNLFICEMRRLDFVANIS